VFESVIQVNKISVCDQIVILKLDNRENMEIDIFT